MAKEVKGYIKLQIAGGQANPAPPVGPALGQYGVPIQEFTTRFNDQTKDKMGVKLPVIITVYEDRSFDFIVKQPPMSTLIKNKLNLKKGSGVPQKDKVGHMSFDQVKEVAEE
ncbi:50S ribosomal protein L11, partial [Candidatus Gracilibacteria bacterium]|nr:50S ribosomal protein L11 [Candidatus Gracilibacteria bacterium]